MPAAASIPPPRRETQRAGEDEVERADAEEAAFAVPLGLAEQHRRERPLRRREGRGASPVTSVGAGWREAVVMPAS
jgi:hypothetical protein